MANYIEKITSGLDWQMPFNRVKEFPLDRSSMFSSLADAKLYATRGADSRGLSGTSYIGQLIVVYENDNVGAYLIAHQNAEQIDTCLIKLASTTASGDLTGDVATLQGQVAGLIEKVGKAAEGETPSTGIYALIDALAEDLETLDGEVVKTSSLGKANGVATLDSDGKVPSSQLPSYVDDVIEVTNFAALPATGEAGKIYVTLDNGKTYRWGGSAYAEISASLAIGETEGTAYDGAKGKANADAIAEIEEKLETIEEGAEVNFIKEVDTAEFNVENGKLSVKEIAAGKITGLNEAVTTKADKVTGATAGNFAGLDANGNLTDSGKKAADFATATQGTKADTAVQGVKVNGTELTKDSDNKVNITVETGTENGNIKVNGSDVAVKGLGSAAYTDADAYATAAQGAKADTAVQPAAIAKMATTDITNALAGRIGTNETNIGSLQTDVNTLKGFKTSAEGELADHETRITDNATAIANLGTTKADSTTVTGIDTRLTTAENKLKDVEAGAQVNIIEEIQVNGTKQTVTDKVVNIAVPTKLSQLDNTESNFATKVEAKAYADAKDGAIAEAKEAGDNAANAVSNLDKELKAVAKSGAAADVTVADTNNKFAGTTVEEILAELHTAIGAGGTASAITLTESDSEDYAKVYTFAQGSTTVGTINIPKDMVVSKGEVVVNPEGQTAGTYIVLTLANATSDKLYINVGDLIEYVTSGSTTGDMVVVDVSADHKVTATITDGTITKAKLDTSVQKSLGLADSALQAADKTELEGKITKAQEDAVKTAAEDAAKIYIPNSGLAETNDLYIDGTGYNSTGIGNEYTYITLNSTGMEISTVDSSKKIVINNVAEPTQDWQAANKNYVDTEISTAFTWGEF